MEGGTSASRVKFPRKYTGENLNFGEGESLGKIKVQDRVACSSSTPRNSVKKTG